MERIRIYHRHNLSRLKGNKEAKTPFGQVERIADLVEKQWAIGEKQQKRNRMGKWLRFRTVLTSTRRESGVSVKRLSTTIPTTSCVRYCCCCCCKLKNKVSADSILRPVRACTMGRETMKNVTKITKKKWTDKKKDNKRTN